MQRISRLAVRSACRPQWALLAQPHRFHQFHKFHNVAPLRMENTHEVFSQRIGTIEANLKALQKDVSGMDGSRKTELETLEEMIEKRRLERERKKEERDNERGDAFGNGVRLTLFCGVTS